MLNLGIDSVENFNSSLNNFYGEQNCVVTCFGPIINGSLEIRLIEGLEFACKHINKGFVVYQRVVGQCLSHGRSLLIGHPREIKVADKKSL